ncbi:MAG: hypothetical protein STHCBS139747_005621 [Sporothrix thermara]
MGKRSADDATGASGSSHKPKRSRTSIRAALPTSDDAWRRKLERAKESKVIRAKTLQTYHKIKARALAEGEGCENKADGGDAEATAPAAAAMHPERQARIDDEENQDTEENDGADNTDKANREQRRPRDRRPPKKTQAYFQKAREEAAQKKAEAEARQAEFARRAAEREEAIAQRKRHQRAMAKARRVDTHGGDNNQRRKLGRESGVLLDRVRKMMGK